MPRTAYSCQLSDSSVGNTATSYEPYEVLYAGLKTSHAKRAAERRGVAWKPSWVFSLTGIDTMLLSHVCVLQTELGTYTFEPFYQSL